MRLTKAMKKAFSIVLAGAMVITGANVGATKASAEDAATEVVAAVSSDVNGWVVDEAVTATIDTTATEAKTYTVSNTYNTPVTVENFLAVAIDALKPVASTVEFSDVKVWLDGKGVAVTPNYGGDEDCRIEIVNEWDPGKNSPLPDSIKGVSFNKVEVEFTIKFVPEGTTDVKNHVAITTGEVTDKADAAVKAFIETDADSWGTVTEGVTAVNATIDTAATEAKTYTVSKTFATPVKTENYTAVKINEYADKSSTVQFSDVSVWLNGHAVEVAPNTGGDGDCRIELLNAWGKTPGEGIKDVYFDKIEVQFTLTFVPEGTVDTQNNTTITFVKAEDKADATDLPTGPAEPSTPEDPGTPSTPADSVWTQEGNHAYVGYQTDIWDYRDAYVPGKTHDDAGSYDYIKAGDDVTYTADVKDVLLEADGEYTVSLAGIDLSGATQFNMLFISTDIERAAYPDVKVTNATVKIDGKVVDGLENVALPINKDNPDYYQFAIASTYAADWGISADELKYAGSDNPLEILPEDSIEVTFTISGLGNKVENEPVGPAKGKQFTKGNFVYKVTKQAMTRTNGAATIVGLSKAGKKAKSLTVANTVKSTGTYNVTAIGKNAFKGAAATSVTLNKNIKSIPASAFANCKKLTTLNLKAKLTSVKKNAFKGCAKKITVKGTSKKANVKTLKKSGYKNFK